MHSANHWGGSFEISSDYVVDDDGSRITDLDRAALSPLPPQLDQTQLSWLLEPQDKFKKKKYVHFGCIVCSHKALKWTIASIIVVFLVFVLPVIVTRTVPKKTHPASLPDQYSIALGMALQFFNAQKSGRLPKSNNISWRGDSGLNDGLPDVNLVGGYYDAGDNIKFHFPMAFSMTMLSWSVIEYSQKYKALEMYDEVRELIKWGTDYLLLTFSTSDTKISEIYAQVGDVKRNHFCWQTPESVNYSRPVQKIQAGVDLAGEMASALASASLVFRDHDKYHAKLVKGAIALFDFAADLAKKSRYSSDNANIEPYYNSTDYSDEYIWGAAWMYYATGNKSYLEIATDPSNSRNAHTFDGGSDMSVLSWDNKLPAVELLLSRLRIFLNPGYPYEDMLRSYHNVTGLNMCSYLREFHVFNWTKGGMIQLNHGNAQPLQYVANAAFLASLFVDYMNASNIPGWFCGPFYFHLDKLHEFATSQVDYILGNNPLNESYVVGYGTNYPKQVHHRAASIPENYTGGCKEGLEWLDKNASNPNLIIGAMVGGPDKFDQFKDIRRKYNYTEPTLAGNAGLVAALVSLTTHSSIIGNDRNTMFAELPPLYPESSPPPPPWKP